MTSPSPGGGGRQASLDGVRALALIAVLAFHAHYTWMPGGFLAVDVFFVLSGYLITRVLLSTHRSWWGYRRFMARRAVRLVPALVIAVAGASVVGLLTGIPGGEVARCGSASAAYLMNFPFAEEWKCHAMWHITWSLAAEEQFYLAWPLVLGGLAWVLRRCRPAAGRGRGLLLAAGVATLGYAAQVVWQLWLRAATEVTTSRMLYPPDTRSLSILLGCALALVLAARGTRRLPAELPGAGPVALLSVAVLVWLFHDAHLGRSVADLLPLVVVAVASLSLVASLVLAPPTALAVRALGSRPMAWLGRASYSCYLWHEVAYRLAEQVSPRGTPVAEVLRFALALSLAAASYELVERPTQRWWVQRSRREERQPERPPVSAGAVAAGASR